jgi:prepilin-type N-terminal cleavage/methylation domain-containing protein
MAHARSQGGFTLVETMVTVGIIGALATMALPAFQRYALRAKAAERGPIMLRMKQAVQDYYVRNGVTVPGGGTRLESDYNPPWPPTSAKRAMTTGARGWDTYFSSAGGGSSVGVEIEGAVYYCYKLIVVETPASGTITVIAAGDLDGDGVVSYKQLVYTRTAGMYQLTSEYPPPGEEDDASSYATF